MKSKQSAREKLAFIVREKVYQKEGKEKPLCTGMREI